MLILVISDVHANFTALEAVIAANDKVDAVWCLGDLVGYGPDPNECIERIRSLPNLTCLLGNHDAAVIGALDLEKFNHDASLSIHWTQSIITPANLDYLKSLPEKGISSLFTLAHASPRSPIWEYVLDPYTALLNFSAFETQIALVGHTHLPLSFSLDETSNQVKRVLIKAGDTVQLVGRKILNPGSVGQPRDHNPKSSYAILDPANMTWRIRRIEYDIAPVQKRIIAAGLPEKHAQRLADGW